MCAHKHEVFCSQYTLQKLFINHDPKINLLTFYERFLKKKISLYITMYPTMHCKKIMTNGSDWISAKWHSWYILVVVIVKDFHMLCWVRNCANSHLSFTEAPFTEAIWWHEKIWLHSFTHTHAHSYVHNPGHVSKRTPTLKHMCCGAHTQIRSMYGV